MIRAALIALLLTGCGSLRSVVNNGAGDEVEVYSRADVDAINAETQCRQLARSMLEAQRCGIRR